MFFDRDDLSFELIDVLYFDQKNVSSQVSGRPFCALSLRLDADTYIDFDGKTEHVSASDIVFLTPWVTYRRRSDIDRMIVFHFLIKEPLKNSFEIIRGAPQSKLEPLFTKALEEWNGRQNGYRYRASALLYNIFDELHKYAAHQNNTTSKPISDALAYMNSNFSDHTLSVAGIASQVHMSETQFRLIFKKETGVSPKHYLSELRFERARSLLGAGYDSVSSVAEKVGYSDSKNFATAFRKKYGHSPSKDFIKYK